MYVEALRLAFNILIHADDPVLFGVRKRKTPLSGYREFGVHINNNRLRVTF